MTEVIGGNAQAVTAFIARWQDSGATERANFQLFLSELCDLLGMARPKPAKPNETENAYTRRGQLRCVVFNCQHQRRAQTR